MENDYKFLFTESKKINVLDIDAYWQYKKIKFYNNLIFPLINLQFKSNKNYTEKIPLPIGKVKSITFEFSNCSEGDYLFIKNFSCYKNSNWNHNNNYKFIFGGRITIKGKSISNHNVKIRILDKEKIKTFYTKTDNSGYYLFENINLNSFVSISTIYQGKTYLPYDLRWFKVCKDEIEIDINI